MAFDGAGRVAVAGAMSDRFGAVLVADGGTGAIEREIYPPRETVLDVDFSPDGRWLVTTAVGTRPALWRWAEGTGNTPTRTLAVPDGRSAVRARFSRDGRFVVTAANDGVARIFDARTGRLVRSHRRAGSMSGATFSPDGRSVLSFGSDGVAEVWNARTGRTRLTLRGHASWISEGAFSADGRRIATASADRTTRVWDAGTGRLLSVQQMHGDTVNSVEFSPDGRTLLSASDDQTARTYPCTTCAPVRDLVRLAGRRLVSPELRPAGRG
jgi:WD40 repeat protein